MKNKKNMKKILTLTILGLIIGINIAGLIIEAIIQLKIINVEEVKLRPIIHLTTLFSLTFLISLIIFWIKILKRKPLLMWWNILMTSTMVIILSKIIWPTMLVKLIPYYFPLTITITIITWLIGYKIITKKKMNLFRKKKKEKDLEENKKERDLEENKKEINKSKNKEEKESKEKIDAIKSIEKELKKK